METKTAPAKQSQGDTMAEKKEERTPSSLYVIKSMGNNIKKAETLKMCKPEELAALKKIHKDMTERWIGGNLGI